MKDRVASGSKPNAGAKTRRNSAAGELCARRGEVSSGCRSVRAHRSAQIRRQGGFTLLEVMLAFAILAGLAAAVAVSWSQNMNKAMNAVQRRELREVADTVFRRILYEIQEHNDQQMGSLEEFYGEWTGFRGLAKEKWRHYTYELIKKEKVAAGSGEGDGDAEAMFGNEDEDDAGSGGSSGSGDEAQSGVSVVLLEVTLHIRETDSDTDDPLITLRTYIRPPDLGDR